MRIQHSSSITGTFNLFCSVVNQIIFQEEGTLDKFIGDGAMAILAPHYRKPTLPLGAVRAALKIRERLTRAVTPLALKRFRVRYGVNSGQVVVGNFDPQNGSNIRHWDTL